jgi:spore germination protein (amino acid permease)
MNIEKGRISSSEFGFLTAALMMGGTFLTTFTFSNSPRDVWLIIIITFLLFLPFSFVFLGLSNMFPRSNMTEIFEKVYGKIFGKIISSLYCFVFIMLTAINIRFPSNYLAGVFMVETPVMVFAVLLLILCIWTVKDGLESVSRLSLFIIISGGVSMLIYFCLLLNRMHILHFLPIMDVPPKKLVQNINIFMTILFGETFSLLSAMAFVKDRKNLKKSYMIGLVVGTMTLIIPAIMVTGVLGLLGGISIGPLIETTRMVELYNINARIEFLFMGFLIFAAFIRCCILYLVAVQNVTTVFNLKDYRNFVIPIGVIILPLILLTTKTAIGNVESGTNSWTIISFFLLIIFPLITFIIAKIKKFPKVKGGEST